VQHSELNIPLSTYRVQLRPEFGFSEAAAIVPYLADLGVTHLYCSPILQAAPGSTHGYDVVDTYRLSADLGGDAGWEELVAATRTHGLGIILDVVPNHMATAPENAQWVELLTTGRDGPAAAWFDVDWDAQDGRVLLPVLGEPLADAPIERDGDSVRYYDHVFPAADPAKGHYRLAWWRLGTEELNYRRFFDVTSLVAVRVEDPDVFTATHSRLLELVTGGEVDGLRIDHPDGLADPLGYLARLRDATGGAWVVVEKILEPGEALGLDWPCAGTTGYDALRRLGGVLLDPTGADPLTASYAAFTGRSVDFDAVIDHSKAEVLERVLPAEVSRLARVAYKAARERQQDLSERGLRAALVALLGCFDVYRAYVRPGEPLSAEARTRLDAATERALAREPARGQEIRFLRRLAVDHDEFAVRFQQTCGPVMAKGLEDTAFYRWFRLSSLNEVGGSPDHFSVSVPDFHADNMVLQRDWPASMTTLTTHDTKRSEDVRARLAVLSEIPAEWDQAVRGWQSRHSFGDPDLEYLCWQTLVGAWPLAEDRARAYLEKASREARLRTSWTDPDPAYESARDAFVYDVFGDAKLLAEVASWVQSHLLRPGHSNVLSQKLLQLAMPGIPDVYQGTECETLSLVDPDNRAPVDYPRRTGMLADPSGDGVDAAKLLVVSRALRLRRQWPDVFRGAYAPLGADGPAADHLVAFTRPGVTNADTNGPAVAALATRLSVGLERRGGWGDTTVQLPAGRWRDVLTGVENGGDNDLALGEVFAALPVALLQRS
jgi:(1->4)-alpha-D-glucan 1-alpha-D-glucosylmutase